MTSSLSLKSSSSGTWSGMKKLTLRSTVATRDGLDSRSNGKLVISRFIVLYFAQLMRKWRHLLLISMCRRNLAQCVQKFAKFQKMHSFCICFGRGGAYGLMQFFKGHCEKSLKAIAKRAYIHTFIHTGERNIKRALSLPALTECFVPCLPTLASYVDQERNRESQATWRSIQWQSWP